MSLDFGSPNLRREHRDDDYRLHRRSLCWSSGHWARQRVFDDILAVVHPGELHYSMTKLLES